MAEARVPTLLQQVERVEDLLEAARSIGPILREHADFAEREGRLADEVVHAMQRAGAFRMTMPRSLGGIEADPVTQYEVIEALSEADGSAGWVAMIGSDGGYLAGQQGDEVGRLLFSDPDLLTAGVFAPTGTAEEVSGGVRVSGRWSFASCCRHASWFGGTCVRTRGGEPILSDGRPQLVRAMLPISEVEILDTWHTTGLSGSGSDDVAAHDVFVPEERVVGVALGSIEKPKNPSPLYAYSMMLMCNVSGVPMGIARRAIDELCGVAREKVGMVGNRPLDRAPIAEDPYLQLRVGRAETALAAARALLIETLEEMWRVLLAGGGLPLDLRSRFRMANLHGFHVAKEVTTSMYEAAGSSSLYRPHPLERALRDVTTVSQHLLVRDTGYAEVGRVSLGLDPMSFLIGS